MNVQKSAPPLHLRWLSVLIGVVLLFWLPIEDHNLTTVTLFSLTICFLGGVFATEKWPLVFPHGVFIGFLSGLFIAPISFVLMVIKIGLHLHGIPDFTIEQLFRLFEFSPIWALSGFFLRAGVHFYRAFRSQ